MSDSQKETKDFLHQLLPVLVGAVIGFVPSFVITTYQAHLQAHEQREQFMLDKKITAVKDLSAAVNGNGKLLANFDLYESYLTVVINFPQNKEARQQLARLADEFNIEYPRYCAELRTQAAIASILFHKEIPMPNFPVEDLPDIPEPQIHSEKEKLEILVRHSKEARTQVQKTRKAVTATIDTYQKLIFDLSKELH
jgi:hypothetical protein